MMNLIMRCRNVLAVVAYLMSAPLLCAPQVEVFTPQGQTKGVRHVAVRFAEPMVAFGDPRLPEPFSVQCEGNAERLKGRGRWADSRNWVYDFDSDLLGGQRCRFTLVPELKSIAGGRVQGQREFTFHTGGPAVMKSLPHEGSHYVDEEQVFILALDAALDAASLSDSWCEATGINERIPLRAVSDKETQEILSANRNATYDLFNVYFKGKRTVPIAQFKIEDKRFRELPVIGVRCVQRLPAGADIGIVLSPQVKSKTGIARGSAQRLAYRVRPAFAVKFSCEKANKEAHCLPVTPMRLQFTAPVLRDAALAVRVKSERGDTYEPAIQPNVKTVESVEFKGPFPEKTGFTVELPRNFRDDAGREPENKSSFPLRTETDESPPLAKFPATFGILELNAEPLLPVTVRNVEPIIPAQKLEIHASPNETRIPGRSLRVADDEAQIIERYRAFTKHMGSQWDTPVRPGERSFVRDSDEANSFQLPKPGGSKPMEVIGIPLPKPGFYVVELASPRLGAALHGEAKPYYVATSVLVTNLSVHLKHGRENSLVWVTTLDRGSAVSGARITVRDCHGSVLFSGTSDSNGVAKLADELPVGNGVPECGGYRELFAFAKLRDDVAFTSSLWHEGIEPWSFRLPANTYRQRALSIHTIFDRMLFRAGETVSMKHLARTPMTHGFRIPGATDLPHAAEIEHIGSGQKTKLDVRFDASGVAENAWKIPPEAKLGTYRLIWAGEDIQADAKFRVEAFRVPLMRGVLAGPKEPLIKPAAIKLDAAVMYLAGGAAAGQPVKLRYRFEERQIQFPDFFDFRFGGNPIKEGLQVGAVSDFWGTFDPDEEPGAETAGQPSRPAGTRSFTLDAAGTASMTIDKLPPMDRPASLLAEMEYSDPNGELLAVPTRVPLNPSAVYIGIKTEGWAANKNSVNAQVVAVDTAGKPLPDRDVSVDVYERKIYSNRRRLLGGFYAYDSTTETRRVKKGCSGTTDARGLLFCSIKPGTSGELILVARAKDDGGNAVQSNTSVWVRGDEQWWFEPTNHDRIDLIPEKKRYEPGDTARLQVRMPFRQATVLVTVEREGILWQRVVSLSGTSPTIEVPVLGNYGPNVFVSALAVRGRVDPEVPGPYAWLRRLLYKLGNWLGFVDEVPTERDTRPTALVDLTKPAYKLGMAEIKVGRRDYELKVSVTPTRSTYRVREKAHVDLAVTDAYGKPASGGEVALAAVDEGLLELMDNTSWNILEALLGQRPIEVATSTAQGQVIGKRHFGRKAAPPGGGGGRSGARELFDTLLVWKGRVALDAQGKASIDVPLNDSLGAFRIVAVAHAGAAKFGHGMATVRSIQDVMLFSGLPPVVRELDEFSGTFTVRNTTANHLVARVTWEVADKPLDDKRPKRLATGSQEVVLAPGEAKLVAVPVKTPVDIERLYWQISINGPNDSADRLRMSQKVIAVHPVRVYQATLARLDRPFEFPVARPADAIPGRGAVRVDVMGSLAGNLSAVREYFLRYAYVCYEQQVSKAIGLEDDALWNAVAARLPAHLDGDGLVRYFPVDWLPGSDTLTAYLLQIAHDAGREWPEQSRARMLSGLEAFATGRIVRGSALPTADLTVRKLAAIEALSRHDRAKSAMLDSISIDPALWPTSALIDWIGILKRVDGISQRNEKLREAQALLRARLNFQGTVMTFSSERQDALWWLMISADVNANRALLAVMDQPDWREDIGRLVRGTLSRQKSGRWGTTVANAWGVVAIKRFAETFEKTPATGNASIGLAGKSVPLKVDAVTQSHEFEWPKGRETLRLAHTGTGAPWAIVQSRAALPLKAPFFTGYTVKRIVTPVEQKDKGGYSRGDVYRVTLNIDAQSDMTWVVVDDPIPSGSLILGSGLGRDAGLLAKGEKKEGWAWPAYIERSYEAYRAYYAFVPKGHFKLEYTVRLNNAGRFDLPSTRVEAMYAPEMFAELPNEPVTVRP